MKKNIELIRALKAEGHDLIDAIVKTGISKSRAYHLLQQKLGTTEAGAHFYNMYTERDVRNAIAHLKQILYIRKELLQQRRQERRARMIAMREQAAKPAPQPVQELPAVPPRWQRALDWMVRKARGAEKQIGNVV